MTQAAPNRLPVALISSGLGHVLRGIEVWMLELARLLPRDQVEVFLWSGGRLDPAPPDWSSLHGLSREAGLIRSCSWHRRYIWEQWSVLTQTLWRLRAHRIRIAYCGDPVLSWHLNRFRRWHGARVVFMNGMRLSPAWAKAFGGVHLLAQPYLDQARQELGAGHTRQFFAVPHFSDGSLFQPPTPAAKLALRQRWGLTADDFVILTVGPLGNVSGKRLEWLAQELAPLDRRIKLLHAGVTEDGAREIRAQVEQALPDRVRFLGCIARPDMPALYQTADIYSLGSLAEPFSIAILEALASGLPVVHHHDPVMTWQTGQGGRPVNMLERGRAGAAIARLASEPAEYQEASQQARLLATSRYHPETVCQALVEAWRQLLILEDGSS
jgi:1,2-diacylglycerol 3-alpha-glucosyltransferase